MEYKHLLEICEQLLKYSALPHEMLDKYYAVKERTLKTAKPDLPVKILQLFQTCFNQMLTQRDLNISNTEQQISYILDIYNVGELRTELQKTFQLVLQLNSDRKEQDTTISFLQNEVRKLKLENQINQSKLDQSKKVQSSEQKETILRLQKQLDDVRDELITKEEEYEERLNQQQFKYEEQLKILKKSPQQSININEQFFDQFAELSLPYLEKYEKEFERHQAKRKKYPDNANENEILLDFLFYLLERYVPLNEELKRTSSKKVSQSPRLKESREFTNSTKKELHFDQYKSGDNKEIKESKETKLEDGYQKLKQEIMESRKTLERYEQSRQKLQQQLV